MQYLIPKEALKALADFFYKQASIKFAHSCWENSSFLKKLFSNKQGFIENKIDKFYKDLKSGKTAYWIGENA